jgi:hypothetical protein
LRARYRVRSSGIGCRKRDSTSYSESRFRELIQKLKE